MLKLASMLLVFIFCSMLGAQGAERLRRREKLLSALQNSVRRLMMRMEYEKKPLAAIAAGCAVGELKPLWKTFSEELYRGEEPRAAFSKALDAADMQIAGFRAVGLRERELLKEFASALGATELDGQKKNAAMLLSGLEPLWEEASGAYHAKGRIYQTMGMLCGAAAVILML